MAGKITTILAKREAETYCLQGLHKEALHIYRKLLTGSPNLDPAFKAGIENQIDKISAELESDDLLEANRLTAADILRVKKGWGDEATESDMLICAQAFHQIGYYQEALVELGGMLRKGCATEKTSTLLADSLVQMCPSSQTVETLEKFYRNHIRHPEDQFHLAMMIAEEMVDLKQPDHAMAIVAYLQKHPAAGERDAQRLAAIADSIGALDTATPHIALDETDPDTEAPAPAGHEDPDAPADPPSPPKGRIRSLFRRLSFFRRNP